MNHNPAALDLDERISRLEKLQLALSAPPTDFVTAGSKVYRGGGSVSLASDLKHVLDAARERDTLRAQLDQAREALRPFADQCECWTKENDALALTTSDGTECASIDFRLGDLRRARETLAAIAPASKGKGDVSVFEFDRYINGVLMAEGVLIERSGTLAQAIMIANHICSRQPGDIVTLVLRNAPDLTAAERARGVLEGLTEARDLARAAAAQSRNASARWTDEDTSEAAIYDAEAIALSRHAAAIDARLSALDKGGEG